MKNKIALGARLLLGLIFFIFGLNGFFHFIPLPPPSSEAAGAYMGGLFGSSYFFPLLALVQTVSGALLLAGRMLPLALILLAPVTVNILLYHVFLDPAGMGMALMVVGLNALLGALYFEDFRPLFGSGSLSQTAEAT